MYYILKIKNKLCKGRITTTARGEETLGEFQEKWDHFTSISCCIKIISTFIWGVTIDRVWIGFTDHLYTPIGTTLYRSLTHID
jgi:hypothetical protein